MKRSKPIRREGKVGRRKRIFRQTVKKEYFDSFGDNLFGGTQAKCQGCGSPMYQDAAGRDAPVAAHKVGRGKGGPDIATNVAIMHWSCHEYFSFTAARIYLLERDQCNAENGLVLKCPANMKENLWEFKDTGVNKFSWE